MQLMPFLACLAALAALPSPAAAARCRAANSVAFDAKLDGNRVLLCFDNGPRTCWSLDLAKPTWQPLRASALPSRGALGQCAEPPCDPRSPIQSATLVTACAPDGSACHTVATALALGLELVTNDTLVAAVEEERITIADARTGQLASSIAPWPHPNNGVVWRFDAVRFLGDRLFVELRDNDLALARVFTARTGAVALELPDVFDSAPPITFHDELVLATTGGAALVFIENTALPFGSAASLGRAKLVDSQRLARRSLPLFAKPAELLLLAATPTTIIAIQRGSDGSLALVDGKTTTHLPGPPTCR